MAKFFMPGLNALFSQNFYTKDVSFICYSVCSFQSSIKWSQPDEDNKCLGEVHLRIDPKCRGMSTGTV